ncbi:MAG: hypothetical protein PHD48_00745 [Alphaproteobacteria bacterium]|nr:hypothetical protein [Alphaproteobacteria bacterium]
MSFSKMGKVLPKKSSRVLDQEIANMVRTALRKDFPKVKLVARAISREIDVNLEAVKKWYNGQNTPSSAHFLVLVRISPSLFEAFLVEVGCASLAPFFLSERARNGGGNQAHNGAIAGRSGGSDVTSNVTINPWPDDLNERQSWFLAEIRDGFAPTAESLRKRWRVTERTARRDIAEMIKLNLIERRGAKKNGVYIPL